MKMCKGKCHSLKQASAKTNWENEFSFGYYTSQSVMYGAAEVPRWIIFE